MGKFIPNPGFERAMLREASYRAGLAAAAEAAAVTARNFAPVDEGDYRDSIEVVVDSDEVRLEAQDWKAGFIEFGTVDTPIFAPLRRGAQAAGLKFKESSR